MTRGERSAPAGPTIELDAQVIAFSQIMRRHGTLLGALRDVGLLASQLDLEEKGHPARDLPRFSDPEKNKILQDALRAFARTLTVAADAADDVQASRQLPPGTNDPPAPASAKEATAAESTTKVSKASTGADTTGGSTTSGVHQETRFDHETGRFVEASLTIDDDDVSALVGEMLTHMIDAVLAPSRGALVRSSVLTAVVATFDALVDELASAFFRAHPEALGDSPEFSLADLSRFATIAAAQEELIRRKVDALDRGLDELAKWFRTRLDIDLSRLAIDWNRFAEVIQRRHLVIHTGGRVSRRYLDKTPGATGLAIGDVLSVDAAYLEAAFDEFLALGTNLVFAVWYKLAPSDSDDMASNFLSATRRAVRWRRWEVVRCQATVAMKLKEPQSTLLAFRVLGWLASKKLNDRDAIESEVREWDVSALAPRWKLSRLCLLDELNEASSLAVELVQSGQLPAMTLLIDPLYDDLSTHPSVITVLRERGVTLEGDTVAGGPPCE